MFVNISSQLKVPDEEAFMFACGQIEDSGYEEKDIFMNIMKMADNFEEAKTAVVEWWYSGNWVKRSEENVSI